VGIDACAHRGAIEAGGATWAVACTGRDHTYPVENRALFASIEASPSSRMIWPFTAATVKDASTPRFRNGVLVALAERVVVVQARVKSGSRNAAAWAWRLGRKLYVVPGAPWDPAFEGSVAEGDRGAETLWSWGILFREMGLPPPGNLIRSRSRPSKRRPAALPFGLPAAPRPVLDERETAVFSALSRAPAHRDAIVEKAGLPVSATVTALLTLSLKNVVVEGPDGFFRRKVTS